MFTTLLLALAASASVPPASADWTIVAENDGGVMAIDPASIQAQGDHRLVWTRAGLIDENGMATSMVMLTDIDCARRTSAKRSSYTLDDDGRPSADAVADTQPQPVGDGSIGAVVLDTVCASR